MKKCLLLFVLGTVLILNSCSVYSPLPPELEDLAFSILKNPERLYNLQNYYPNYFNEDYIDNSMKDSAYLSKLINEMKKWEKKSNNLDLGLDDFEYYPNIIENTNNGMKGRINSLENLYGFDLIKDREAFVFIFIRVENKYYINVIGRSLYPI
jgi:hypothetical protein